MATLKVLQLFQNVLDTRSLKCTKILYDAKRFPCHEGTPDLLRRSFRACSIFRPNSLYGRLRCRPKGLQP